MQGGKNWEQSERKRKKAKESERNGELTRLPVCLPWRTTPFPPVFKFVSLMLLLGTLFRVCGDCAGVATQRAVVTDRDSEKKRNGTGEPQNDHDHLHVCLPGPDYQHLPSGDTMGESAGEAGVLCDESRRLASAFRCRAARAPARGFGEALG